MDDGDIGQHASMGSLPMVAGRRLGNRRWWC